MSKWETKKLGLIIKRLGIKHVSAERLSDIALPYGNIKLLSTGNFDGYTIPELANGYVYNNEVITLPTGGSANIKYYNGSFVDSGNIVFITNKNHSTKFVYCSMMKDISYFENCYRGSSIKHPEMKDVYSHLIKTPTNIIEADKIAEVLSSVDENIEQTKSIIEKYKNIKLGMMQDILNKGETKTISQCAKIISGSTPSTSIADYWDGENIWLTPNDLNSLKSPFVANSERKLTDEGVKKSVGYLLPVNSIIISNRAPVGYCAIVTKPFTFNQGCKGLICNKNTDPLYLHYVLSQSVNALERVSSGTTFLELPKKELARFKIKIPKTIEKQKDISFKIWTVDLKIIAEQEYLDKLLKLKQGLMQDLLTNKVSVLPLMKKEV